MKEEEYLSRLNSLGFDILDLDTQGWSDFLDEDYEICKKINELLK